MLPISANRLPQVSVPQGRLVRQQPMENPNWLPQSDGVFVSSDRQSQWKPNLSGPKMSELRGQLSAAEQNPVDAGDLTKLPTGSWVVQAKQAPEGRLHVSLFQQNDTGSEVKAEFSTLDGFHFSGDVPKAAGNSTSLLSSAADGLFLVSDRAAAAMIETAQSKEATGSLFPKHVREQMSWGQKFMAVVKLPAAMVSLASTLVKDGPSALILGPSPAGGEKTGHVGSKTLFSSPFPTL